MYILPSTSHFIAFGNGFPLSRKVRQTQWSIFSAKILPRGRHIQHRPQSHPSHVAAPYTPSRRPVTCTLQFSMMVMRMTRAIQ